MDSWAYRNKVHLDFIRPGKPVENGITKKREFMGYETYLTFDQYKLMLTLISNITLLQL